MIKDAAQLSSWQSFGLGMAEYMASRSKDPSTQVGAVILDPNNRVVGVGFNGFPHGIRDDHRLNDRETKYEMIIHGEMNAILFARRDLHGCTLYTHPFMPCSRCAVVIIQVGLSCVITPYNDNERWQESFKLTRALFDEAGVELVEAH